MATIVVTMWEQKSPGQAVPALGLERRAFMGKNTLTVIDNRTGKSYEIPIFQGTNPTYRATIRAPNLRQIKTSEDDFGLMSYDPAFMNTASCQSRITFVDGEKGILRYRGYPIEELAEKSTYLETSYLILYGELPTEVRLKERVQTSPSIRSSTRTLRSLWTGFTMTRIRWVCW